MEKKSKIFFIVFGLLIASSVAATYWRIIIQRDYIIEAQTDCDPMIEKCFVWQCDPTSEVEGEKCTGVTEDDVFYYKIIKRNASRIPLCDPADENCQALMCGDNEPECEYVFCNEENKIEQGVECNDPTVYAAENIEPEIDKICPEGEVCLIDEEYVDASATTSAEEAVCDDGSTCPFDNSEIIETNEAGDGLEEASTSEIVN